MASGRIETTFARLKQENRAGLVTFTMGGDPDFETSAAILEGLPAAGADIIEYGFPFSDPMADGPVIQDAGLRALEAGARLPKILGTIARFRGSDDQTPVIMMGYFNPILQYGPDRFIKDALASGVDGLIIVDLPPEEDGELCLPSLDAGLAFIRMVTPTTDEKRLAAILRHTAGFLYYVSITGITGGKTPDPKAIVPHLDLIRSHTNLPIAVGFGIKSAANVASIAEIADAAVVGTSIVSRIGAHAHDGKIDSGAVTKDVFNFVQELACGTGRNTRLKEQTR